jgi:TRAP-type C4-dicarboxylate transport system permease large subunit
MLIIGFAAPLGYVISRGQIAGGLSELIVGSSQDQTLVMATVAALLLIVGCFMEVAAAIILLTPVLGVALIAAGIDPIYIGVMMVYTLGIGLVTPPVGLCLYVGSQISGISLEKVIVAVWPFLIPLVVTMALIIIFPQLITWLPSVAYSN